MFLENVLCANNSLGRSINLLHAGEFPITCIYINPLQTEKKRRRKKEGEGREEKEEKEEEEEEKDTSFYLFLVLKSF